MQHNLLTKFVFSALTLALSGTLYAAQVPAGTELAPVQIL
ncbi:Uncharacterised protein [Rodentibacter pneumotropicus]|uniref:Uncharacterized protein n=1 Tax=Rodentibacter pneumotropicus TaxID=758 RepID=A0A448MJL0_9PAST|nr:Uncharacterised protein [Rodentibacter pneumotropicus]